MLCGSTNQKKEFIMPNGAFVMTSPIGIPVNQQHQPSMEQQQQQEEPQCCCPDNGRACCCGSSWFSFVLLIFNCIFMVVFSIVFAFFQVQYYLTASITSFIYSILLMTVPTLSLNAIIWVPIMFAIFVGISIWQAILGDDGLSIIALLLFDVPQLILFSFMAVAVRKREAGKWCCCLPLNVNKDGQVVSCC